MSKLKPLQTDKRTVTQDNQLITAAYSMTLQEKRLLMLGVSKLQPQKKHSGQPLSFTLTIEEWLHAFPDAGGGNPYGEIKKAAKRLMGRTVYIKGRNEDKHLNWLDGATYHKREARVTITFGFTISHYLTGLLGEFTKYDLLAVRELRSVHAVRIYELCAQFKSTGFRIIYVDDLRDALQLGDSYQKFADLRKWVIDPACDEITKKTNLQLGYDSVRDGRRIKAIRFLIAEKSQIALPLE
jgi:plasmid replication initiation protein